MKETILALLIDDDQGDFSDTKELLNQIRHPKIELDWVPTFEEDQDAIAQGGYDIYLVDYFLGETVPDSTYSGKPPDTNFGRR